MKKYFISTLLVLFAVCSVKAQQDTIKVHLDGTASLESLMEGVWEQNAKCLRLTGTPTEEDISYLHEVLVLCESRFNTYDFKSLEIKRIPKNFFLGIDDYPVIILPKYLEYIEGADYGGMRIEFVLTGKFPEISHSFSFSSSFMRVSDDNPFCKGFIYYEVTSDEIHYVVYNIYSINEDILYLSTIDKRNGRFSNVLCPIVINEGTTIIHERAINSCFDAMIILPESLDSIGIYAIASPHITCHAKTPPKLGKGALEHLSVLYVPEESFNHYINSPGWDYAEFTNGIQTGRVNISESTYIKIDCKRVAASYIITSYIPMKNISIYTLSGMLLKNNTMDVKEYKINLQSFPKSPLLLRVELENGDCETIKIIP